jgi:hypothetical protein
MPLPGVGQELSILHRDVFVDRKDLTSIMQMLNGSCCVATRDGSKGCILDELEIWSRVL